MAIGTINDKDNNKISIEELKSNFEKVANGIRKILNGRKDKNDIPQEDKNKLRVEYSKAAQIAKSIYERSTDAAEVKLYKDNYKKLLDTAASYGSIMTSKVPSTTFDDVKGLENVKKLVKSFLFMAQNPDVLKYYKLDGGLGMMMYGAPGTGKTMFAEAIAHEMNLPLFIVTPADIFKSYVGESEQAVKQLFNEIDACPDGAILFVDECESIFSKRTNDTKDYKAAVTTELLQRINGFGINGSKRIMIAATNRPDIIDSAYLRYKRFSHLIHVTPPDDEAKLAIIESKLKNIKLDDITTDEILEMTNRPVIVNTSIGSISSKAYYSAADLCGVIEEACRLALEKMQAKSDLGIKKFSLDDYEPLNREMFERAFNKIPPSISQELFDQYENFRKNVN